MTDSGRSILLQIDDKRSITISETDGATIVLAVEDPHTVAIVELIRTEVHDLIESLGRLAP